MTHKNNRTDATAEPPMTTEPGRVLSGKHSPSSSSLRILLVEDNPADAYLIQDKLQEIGSVVFQIEAVPRLSEALAHLASGGVDLMLVDLNLPDSQGMDTFHRLLEAAPRVPLVILTGNADEELALTAMREGAQDYLVKGQTEGHLLLRSIRYAVERKKAEEALRALFYRQQALLSAIPDIIIEVDTNRVITWANPTGLEFYGKDVLGKAASYYFVGEQDTYSTVAPLFGGSEEVIYVESWQRRKDGENRLLAWWCRALKDSDQNIIGAISTGRDVTERKQVEEKLRESEQRFRSMAEQLQDALFITNEEGIIAYASPSASHIFGWKPEEMTGRKFTEYLPANQIAKAWESFSKSFSTGRTVRHLPLIMKRKDGSVFPGELQSSPVMKDGESVGIQCLIRDITERNKIEETQAKLQKLESLGTLAGGIAHDFNNILTVILGNISFLQSQIKMDGLALELIEDVKSACKTATGLSNQLLTFSKGGRPIIKVMDLRNVLRQSVDFAARGSNVRSILDLGASPLAVNIDQDQIAQVVQNLVINATQAMSDGGNLMVRAALVTLGENESPPLAAGRYVQVMVEDEGSGIPPEHLSKIFDPYFSTKAAGRGLGLSVCYSIMAKHGGTIQAYSRPGAGAIFTLHFPAASTKQLTSEGEQAALTTGRGRVLIMDDDTQVAKVLQRMIESLGYKAESVGDGQAVLDAYGQELKAGQPYDAVIMDLTIPGGMGGKEAIGHLTALDPAVKAIVSSGYSNEPIMSEYAANGFCGVLTKPYRIEEVSQVLRQLVGKKVTLSPGANQ